MKLKALSLAALFVLGTAPTASHAQTGAQAALDSCVKSFVETYLPGHPVRKVAKDSPATGILDRFWQSNKYTILLSARGVESRDVIAQARCVADRKGIVIVLDQPSFAALRTLRADFVVSMR